MALSDTKKVQTMLNTLGQQAQIVRDAVAAMNAVKDEYLVVNPDPTGTPLEGNVAIVLNALADLSTEASNPVWTSSIAAVVPTHRNEALD